MNRIWRKVIMTCILTFLIFAAACLIVHAYEAVDPLYGDVNGDFSLTSTDYLLVKKIFAGFQVSDDTQNRADINKDGSVTSTDYLILKQVFTGKRLPTDIQPLPTQPPISDPGKRITYSVSRVFTSNMVLQRDRIINVWGWSKNTGGYIYGEFMGEKRYAKIDSNGEWLLQFSPKAYTSVGQTLTIGPKNGTQKTFTNILVGDVWIVCGQSNAEYSFSEMATYYTSLYNDINSSDNIRLYRENKSDAYSGSYLRVHGVQDDVIKAYQWTKTTRDTVDPFSALGYTFVKELADHTDVPQGIVMATAGGCKIEDFMDPDTARTAIQHGTFWPETQAIYKFLMAPFRHMTFTGMLFYQGESDNLWYEEYADSLTACVDGWRKQFDSDFTLYNVQCTSHKALETNTRDWAGLPFLRAAQLDAYYKIPNSYLISTVDVGYRLRPLDEPEEDYAHTFNKFTIGRRAAHIALANYYQVSGYDYRYVCCPIPDEVTWNSDHVLIRFKNVGDGLKSYDGSLIGFKNLLNNGVLINTTATILDKETVKVSFSVASGNIKGICYGIEHSALLEEANLVNSSDIPCPTFCFYRS